LLEIEKPRSHPPTPRHASLSISFLVEIQQPRSHPHKPRHASLILHKPSHHILHPHAQHIDLQHIAKQLIKLTTTNSTSFALLTTSQKSLYHFAEG
jgi:hypothetical protein